MSSAIVFPGSPVPPVVLSLGRLLSPVVISLGGARVTCGHFTWEAVSPVVISGGAPCCLLSCHALRLLAEP